jgi:TetR/AcrR family transcriptional repressor of nem operon
MNAKTEKKERSHETILASAAALLRDKGISGARVADVMKRAGLTVGGFYAHFASKESLIDEAIRRTATENRDRLFADLEQKPEGDRAVVVLKRYLSAQHRDHTERGCPLPAIVGEVATTAPEHAAALAGELETFGARLAAELPAERPLPRRAMALGLIALMYGGLSLARALRGTELSDEVIKACRALGVWAVRGAGDDD